MIKTLSKLGIERILLNLIKIIYKKPTANITVNGEKLKAFLVISGTRFDYPLSSFHFNIILEVLVNVIIQEKKSYTDWGGEMSLLTDDIRRKPERTDKKTPETDK